MKIAALGPEGTYSHQAAAEFYPNDEIVLATSIPQVVEMVAGAECSRGVAPWENSSEGTVRQTLDGLFEHDLLVIDETYMDIHHVLWGLKQEKAKMIYSHPQALAQCREYIRRHYPESELVEMPSTVAGIETIGKQLADGGVVNALAIGPSKAGEKYGLKPLDESIEDTNNNQTQFVTFAKQPRTSKELDFTLAALVPEQDHKGLLHRITGILLSKEVNLSAIESRPKKGADIRNYMFYVRMDLPSSDSRYGEIADELDEMGVATIKLSV